MAPGCKPGVHSTWQVRSLSDPPPSPTPHLVSNLAPLAQLAEHLSCKQEVAGSNPAGGSTKPFATPPPYHRRFRTWPSPAFAEWLYADVAQLAERHPSKVEVAGSRPAVRSKDTSHLCWCVSAQIV